MRMEMAMITMRLVSAVLLAAPLLLRGSPTQAQTNPLPEEFSAIFANISNVGAVGAAPVTIRITRWTDDAENEKLMAVLSSKGTEALVRELQSAKSAGSIGTPQELAYDLRYARQQPLDGGGRQIVLMTDRPMAPAERMSASRSRDYPVTWIELRLDPNGRGEGTISIAARLRLLGNVMGIEDYGTQPARLNQIRKIK
jgi:hypothetical protein